MEDPQLGECYDVLTGMPRSIAVMDGEVTLVDCSPRLCPKGRSADYAIVEAARTSYGKGLKSPDEDRKLLHYLFRNKHWSPVEFVRFKFKLQVPIFVARQLMRHRMMNICEFSLRYAQAADKFYFPHQYRSQDPINKQSSIAGVVESDSVDMSWKTLVQFSDNIYHSLLDQNVCREQARAVLPLGTYTSLFLSIDLRNLFNLLSLRMDSHAQEETRLVAHAMYTLIQPIVPESVLAWKSYCFEAITLTKEEIDAIRSGTTMLSGASKTAQNEFDKKLVYLFGLQ
jgi:thymidylate synthase (FAD)